MYIYIYVVHIIFETYYVCCIPSATHVTQSIFHRYWTLLWLHEPGKFRLNGYKRNTWRYDDGDMYAYSLSEIRLLDQPWHTRRLMWQQNITWLVARLVLQLSGWDCVTNLLKFSWIYCPLYKFHVFNSVRL